KPRATRTIAFMSELYARPSQENILRMGSSLAGGGNTESSPDGAILTGGKMMSALGSLLEACRPYLLLVAHEHLQPDVQGKDGPSDLVQETFLKAQQHFDRFQGETEEELLAWLRRILFNNLLNSVRHYSGTDKRRIDREVELASKNSIDPAPSPGSDLIARE